MSEANVETVKQAIDAFNRRDLGNWSEIARADYTLFSPMFDVEGNSYRGREGVETYFGEIRDAWEEYRLVAEEFRDLGDRVLVLGRLEGRGRGSGVQVEMPWGAIYGFRGGKVSRSHPYLDHGEALRASGLSE